MAEPFGARPLVSVIIPTFNAAATIEAALASVRAQTYRALEILVVDDGSGDGTLELVRRAMAEEPRLSLLRHERNLGPAAARNTGLNAAAGHYTAFLDADDEWLPEKLERQVAALRATPRAVLCCCNAVWVRDGVPEGTVYDGCAVSSGPDAWKGMLEDVYVGTPCAMVDTALARQLGGFDTRLRVGEDQDLWLRLAFAGAVVALPEVLVRYRLSPGSYMARHRKLSIVDWLPRLRAHVAARRRDLTAAEHRRIVRRISERMGRSAYRNGEWRRAMPLLLRAARHGANPLGIVYFLVRSSRPVEAVARAAKSVLRTAQ